MADGPVIPIRQTAAEQVVHIDCDACSLQGSDACQDCVVSFLLDLDERRPVVVDLAEARAMRVLGDAGLAPPLRHRHVSG